jgi:nucleoside-diphosphate-sugar epimerase
MKFKGARVLITGGAGFIGSNLARRLIDEGAKVTIIDNFMPEYGANLENLRGIQREFILNISDIRDPHALRVFIKDQDYLFNLAGQTSHMDSMKDPFTDLDINVKAQVCILESCRLYNPDIRVVFAGTRQIYGRPDYLPVDEKHPIRPTDVNGINKLAGEWYHSLYNQVYGIRSTILRLTNTYGPRMRIKDARQTFVGVWIRLLLEGKPFEVWGGEQLRDFTYVDDCVEAFLLAVEDPAIGKIYNLGGECHATLIELADMLSEGNREKYVVRQFPSVRKKIDIGDYYSSFDKINQELGWEPKICLKIGIERTINYYSDKLSLYL